MSAVWPVTLREGPVSLRPLRRRDAHEWRELRTANRQWLTPWEATLPSQPPGGIVVPGVNFSGMMTYLRQEARAGRMLPFALTHEGALVGQVSVSGILYGSFCSGSIGYWVAQRVAGRGIVPLAVAMAIDHCFGPVGLHRVEINIRPENTRSLRVVEKLGLREEGFRPRLLHIDGAWHDHRSFAVTSEEVGEGMVARLRATTGTTSARAEN